MECRQKPGGAEEGQRACGRDLLGSEYGLLQVLLQVLIIITGNYNFFNLLTLVLTTSLLDDEHLAALCGHSHRNKTPACECPPVPHSLPPSALLPTYGCPCPSTSG